MLEAIAEHTLAVVALLVGTFFISVIAIRGRRARSRCTDCHCSLINGLHRMQWMGRWYCLSCYSNHFHVF
jgi:hypothetical protein